MKLGNFMIMPLLFFLEVLKTTCGDYASDEGNLLDALRNNYRVDHRPYKTTQVSSSIAIFALNKLDIGSEVMSMTAVMLNQWHDPRLIWTPANYSDIEQIVIPTKYVWTPPLVIENEVTNVGLVGTDGSPLRVMSQGLVLWTPPISATTSCSVDITYYPYDKQTCILIVTGWSYTVDEMNLLTEPSNAVQTIYYTENGEWDLINTDYELFNLTNGVSTYRKLYFKITFRRKWQFYGQNVIIPIVLNSLLMAMVFVVPIESGEKMGYCLTVLLSYTVLLTMVSDSLPSISSQISVIQIYLSVVMCLGTAGTVCTIAVIRLHNKDESTPVPRWLQTITRYVLAPVTCRSCKVNIVISPSLKEPASPSDKAQHLYSFKEIAQMVDTIFFRLFAFMMLAMTVAFLVTLNNSYEKV